MGEKVPVRWFKFEQVGAFGTLQIKVISLGVVTVKIFNFISFTRHSNI
jgi:hypothetical protein